MSVSCKVCCVTPDYSSLPSLLTHPFSLFSSPLHFLHLHPYATIGIQCVPPSHTKAATPRSPRSKPKSTRTSSSPSSGTRIRPCYTRRTFGYSSGSTSRACWTRPTREPSFSLGMSWSACAGSRTGDGPSAQTQGNRRGSHVPAGEDGCHDMTLRWGRVTSAVSRAGCTCILLRVT